MALAMRTPMPTPIVAGPSGELVARMETPSIALADGELLAPFIGAIDSAHAQKLTAR
jgi:hypothetical protein